MAPYLIGNPNSTPKASSRSTADATIGPRGPCRCLHLLQHLRQQRRWDPSQHRLDALHRTRTRRCAPRRACMSSRTRCTAAPSSLAPPPWTPPPRAPRTALPQPPPRRTTTRARIPGHQPAASASCWDGAATLAHLRWPR
uniref:Uncharacterized protein n=1 Tax=Arundo donax TaxID=35708 RepID=A0A0A9GHL6_ARUDO